MTNPPSNAMVELTDQKKNIVFVTNCHAVQLIGQLELSEEFRAEYNARYFPSYLIANDADPIADLSEALIEADVLVTQNVQNIEALTTKSLLQMCKPDVDLIRLAFWRFDGFWPIEAQRYNDSFWYLPAEINHGNDFDSYINADLNSKDVEEKFFSEIHKFEKIDKDSDYSMFGFFCDNIRRFDLFSDHWHPTSIFFHPVARYIMRELGLNDHKLPLRANDLINRDRYRLVFNSVSDVLGLRFDPSVVRFHDHQITRQTFFKFSQHVPSLSLSGNTAEIPAHFDKWKPRAGVRMVETNIAELGVARQSSPSVWSKDHDAQRALWASSSAGFAFHTAWEERPWWQVDLRGHREVSRLRVSNRSDGGPEGRRRALPLKVMSSIDGEIWQEILTVNFPFGSIFDAAPLDLKFDPPIICKFIRLEVQRESALHLEKVEVFTKVLALNSELDSLPSISDL